MQTRKSPYEVIQKRYVTEKTQVLQGLASATSNKSLSKCDKPKYTFIVADDANKSEIKKAIEEIYSKKKITVKSVNTVTVPRKRRVVRRRVGYKSAFKKAIVTLAPGDSLE